MTVWVVIDGMLPEVPIGVLSGNNESLPFMIERVAESLVRSVRL